MEDINLLIIGLIQTIALLVYRWVGKVFFSQTRDNHPPIFWNPVIRNILSFAPLVIIISMVILAFFVTLSPWWFLIVSLVFFFIFSPKVPPRF